MSDALTPDNATSAVGMHNAGETTAGPAHE
jgi:hypothetical protein